MEIKNYSDLNSLEIDALREIGSIGTGNARLLNGSAAPRPLPRAFWHSWGERSTVSCSPYTSSNLSI